VAAERLPEFSALLGALEIKPRVTAPAAAMRQEWTSESALINLVRGRLQGLGPVTAATLAVSLGITEPGVEQALLALEQEGFVLRGSFGERKGGAVEWCERRLLARIHRYTLNRLRNEIAPVSAATFAQFLFRWQHAAPQFQLEGEPALEAVLRQLEGFAAPALAWERDLLPLRLRDFTPDMLDRLCLSGRYTWLRLAPSSGRSPVLKLTPISLVSRRRLGDWRRLAAGADAPPLAATAQVVLETLQNGGPAFFEELIEATGLLPNQVEQALGVLVAAGRVHADSFSGLRRLMHAGERQRHGSRRKLHDYGGRWACLKPMAPASVEQEDDSALARVLLNRYGVVFRKLLDREAGLPPWRRMLACLRRLEARGEVRGGRFVSGFAGEQFALSEAVASLRELQRNPPAGELVTVSGADPLNLAGILMPGPRLPALTGNRVLYRDGVPLAYLKGKTVSFEARIDDREHWQLRNVLIKQQRVRI
jgi:ATP-dependent Lhr-like helicase